MRTREPCVYILASGFNGTLYVGVTSNLLARLHQPREGEYGGFTSRHRVTRLVWFEHHETMETAIAAEKRIKLWPRDYKKNLIERITRLGTISPSRSASSLQSSRPVDPGSRPG